MTMNAEVPPDEEASLRPVPASETADSQRPIGRAAQAVEDVASQPTESLRKQAVSVTEFIEIDPGKTIAISVGLALLVQFAVTYGWFAKPDVQWWLLLNVSVLTVLQIVLLVSVVRADTRERRRSLKLLLMMLVVVAQFGCLGLSRLHL